ncbi:transposase [Acinetobacter sichuanensis]|uniref:transposase n=1 Tax=Acinetobacter sichuanensis TaxID=2136183 RepID=UPI0028102308|nr:transposase [Acinetobacter sichuanensis]MDQ9019956.1 transposase [Acinetobacter sichuanensis]
MEFTKSKKQKIYTAEFKAEVVKAINSNNGNVSETARQIGISMQTLSNWYNKTREEAKANITKYIVLFYNQQIVQKGLGFKTAEDFYKLAA